MENGTRQTEKMLRVFAVIMLRTLDSANLSNGIARKMADYIANKGFSVSDTMEILIETTPMTDGPKRSDMLYFDAYVKYCEHCDSEYVVENADGCLERYPPAWVASTIEKGRYCSVKKGLTGAPYLHPR